MQNQIIRLIREIHSEQWHVTKSSVYILYILHVMKRRFPNELIQNKSRESLCSEVQRLCLGTKTKEGFSQTPRWIWSVTIVCAACVFTCVEIAAKRFWNRWFATRPEIRPSCRSCLLERTSVFPVRLPRRFFNCLSEPKQTGLQRMISSGFTFRCFTMMLAGSWRGN